MKVLLLDNWGEKAKGVLGEYFIPHTATAITQFPEYFYSTDGIVVSLGTDKDYIKSFPNLKFIVSCTTGLDHIDTEYCKAKGIKIISLQGETDFLQDVWATAEHTWALIMSLVRKIPFAHNDVCAGNWEREKWQGSELRGKTLGIVGYGRVGRQISKFAEAFGMNQVVYDKKFEIDICPSNALFTGRFDDIFKHSDIITVHVPLNDETRWMFGYKEFHNMKPSAYFINTSRGGVVSEDALLMALKDGWIKGAAIDVAQNEPEIWTGLSHYAKQHDNLIITPHIAGNTAESREKTQLFIANKIKDFMQGGG